MQDEKTSQNPVKPEIDKKAQEEIRKKLNGWNLKLNPFKKRLLQNTKRSSRNMYSSTGKVWRYSKQVKIWKFKGRRIEKKTQWRKQKSMF